MTNFEKKLMATKLEEEMHKLDTIITIEILISINGLALVLMYVINTRILRKEI